MLRELGRQFPGDDWVAIVPGRGPLREPPIEGVELRRTTAPGLVLFGSAALTGRPRLDRIAGARPDVVWLPTVAPVGVSRDVPIVLTIHDRSFESRPHDFTRYERLWHLLANPRGLAQRAARVTTVSATVLAELRGAGWQLPDDRVRVIRSGPGTVPEETGSRLPLGVEGPYLLSVGALEPRKGLDVLLAAFRDARVNASLVVVGEGRLAPTLAGHKRVIGVGRVEDAQLDALYRGALALVHPAYLEGFAFPPLEAAARGIPAIVSDLPIYAETLGAGALRVPAGDAGALASAMRSVVADPALRATLAGDAAAAAGALSWERAADQLHAVLAEAAR